MSGYIEKLKNKMFEDFDSKKEYWCVGETILTNDDVKKQPLVIRKALAINLLLSKMPVVIKECDLVVGMKNKGDREFGNAFPSYALPEELENAAKYNLDEKSVFGHHPINSEKMLKLGFRGYRKLIYEKLSEELERPSADQRVLDEYRAMLISLDAVEVFAKRYSEHAFETALAEKDDQRRKELLKVSYILTRVPENPPESFHEALQMHWIVYAALHSILECIPTGRSDQYLYPYYKRDIDNGTITVDEARDLLASWLSKYSDHVQFNEEHWEYTHQPKLDVYSGPDEKRHWGAAANVWLMNMILGGQTSDGQDAVNDLSYMILEIWNQLELVSPVMNVRINEKTPPEFLDACSRALLQSGSGEPAIYNDELLIKGLVAKGIPIEDARNYSNNGCWEVLIHGSSEQGFDFVNMMQALEYTLFRGKSLMRGSKEGIDLGDPVDFNSYDELYAAFINQLENQIDVRSIQKRRNLLQKAAMIAPDPLISVFMDDCIENGKDLTDGGARYAFAAPLFCGVTNAVDSLAAIKKLVYEEKMVDMPTLLDALRSNFKNYEGLQQTLLYKAPKFGNDDDYVDGIAVKLLADASDYVKRREKECPRLLMPMGIGTFERYVFFGLHLGASADGRNAEEEIASNYSPAPGRDVNGVTAVLHSFNKTDLLPYVFGCALDIQINASDFTGADGIKRISALIRSFCDLGGTIFTISNIDAAVLQDAQIHPEKYKNLRVRYGGYSGYFIIMPKQHQDVIIKRVKHGT